jgi:4-amino-4-deoxy-L-arabinose transferase-like glycosyltransferase
VTRFDRLFVPLVAAASFALCVAGSWGHSATYDEPYHLGAGVARLTQRDHRLAPDHPPLAQELAALAALPRIPADKLALADLPENSRADAYAYGRHVLFEGSREQGDAALHRARAAIALLAAAGVVLVWFAARTLLGEGAARLAALLLLLDPAWLAHGGLVTTDMAAAASFLAVVVAAAFAFAPAAGATSAALRTTLFALALAALFLSKFSALLALPVVAVVALASIVLAGRGRRSRATWRAGVTLFAAAVVTIAGIWAAYGFRWSAVPDPARDDPAFLAAQEFGGTEPGFAQMLAPKGESPSPLRAPLTFLRAHRLLPEAYVWGMAQTWYTTRRRSSFFCGELGETGRVAYFPVAFLLKTPLALQLLGLGGAIALLLRLRRRGAPAPVAAATRERDAATGASERRMLQVGGFAFVAVYGASSLAASINIGHRHLLPLEPWLAILAACCWPAPRAAASASAPASRRWRGLACVGALAWLGGSDAAAFPQWLAYFHELAGGAIGGRRFLLDSNVDWGQDLARLARWQQERGVATVDLARFGTAPPAFYGVHARELPSMQPFGGEPAHPFESGVYVIAATQFESVYFGVGRRESWDATGQRLFQQLLARPIEMLDPRQQEMLRQMSFGRLLLDLHANGRPPDETVGASLLVFRFDDAEMAALRERCQRPLTSRTGASSNASGR